MPSGSSSRLLSSSSPVSRLVTSLRRYVSVGSCLALLPLSAATAWLRAVSTSTATAMQRVEGAGSVAPATAFRGGGEVVSAASAATDVDSVSETLLAIEISLFAIPFTLVGIQLWRGVLLSSTFSSSSFFSSSRAVGGTHADGSSLVGRKVRSLLLFFLCLALACRITVCVVLLFGGAGSRWEHVGFRYCPSLIFVSAYSVVSLFWAAICCACRGYTLHHAKWACASFNILIWTSYLIVAGTTLRHLRYRLFCYYSKFLAGISYLITAGVWSIVGGLLIQDLKRRAALMTTPGGDLYQPLREEEDHAATTSETLLRDLDPTGTTRGRVGGTGVFGFITNWRHGLLGGGRSPSYSGSLDIRQRMTASVTVCPSLFLLRGCYELLEGTGTLDRYLGFSSNSDGGLPSDPSSPAARRLDPLVCILTEWIPSLFILWLVWIRQPDDGGRANGANPLADDRRGLGVNYFGGGRRSTSTTDYSSAGMQSVEAATPALAEGDAAGGGEGGEGGALHGGREHDVYFEVGPEEGRQQQQYESGDCYAAAGRPTGYGVAAMYATPCNSRRHNDRLDSHNRKYGVQEGPGLPGCAGTDASQSLRVRAGTSSRPGLSTSVKGCGAVGQTEVSLPLTHARGACGVPVPLTPVGEGDGGGNFAMKRAQPEVDGSRLGGDTWQLRGAGVPSDNGCYAFNLSSLPFLSNDRSSKTGVARHGSSNTHSSSGPGTGERREGGATPSKQLQQHGDGVGLSVAAAAILLRGERNCA
eukprot:GHVU01189446.1.p1 GENE.GHVU01189446.1~~GHVU01189446.1.p1  ORF type:complete len:756 (-),score=64.85 GHVU01189446.1:1626-3893(-)